MAAGANDEQAKSIISQLAAAKPINDHLKQAFRVELCRWFLPYESPRACPQIECIPCSFYGNVPLDFLRESYPSVKKAAEFTLQMNRRQVGSSPCRIGNSARFSQEAERRRRPNRLPHVCGSEDLQGRRLWRTYTGAERQRHLLRLFLHQVDRPGSHDRPRGGRRLALLRWHPATSPSATTAATFSAGCLTENWDA